VTARTFVGDIPVAFTGVDHATSIDAAAGGAALAVARAVRFYPPGDGANSSPRCAPALFSRSRLAAKSGAPVSFPRRGRTVSNMPRLRSRCALDLVGTILAMDMIVSSERPR
jgi:hypothetical protein